MRALILHLDTGRAALIDAPDPTPQPHEVVVRTLCSAVSIGTERMLASFARASLLDKARQQPERVRQVITRARQVGVMQTAQIVQRRLAEPLALGYAQVGEVVAVGELVEGFAVGQRIVSNGPHASMAAVPGTLCAILPDGVPAWQAAHTPICAVALHALRLASPQLGELCVIVGAGLIGYAATQLALANGCEVLVVEPDPARRALVRELGALTTTPEEAEDACAAWSAHGADLALVCASGAAALQQAARLCRRRGRLVQVGAGPVELERAVLYERELTVQVAASYGPGRYAPGYEEQGLDYPLAHVRWTAQRNFEAVLGLMQRGALRLDALAPTFIAPEDAPARYDALVSGKLGCTVIQWDASTPHTAAIHAPATPPAAPCRSEARALGLGIIGAGTFASQTFLPALAALGLHAEVICAASGISAGILAAKYKIPRAVSRWEEVVEDPAIEQVAILTRHDTHATIAAAALAAGKDVFVEKPLCVTQAQLDTLRAAWEARPRPDQRLVVGANRRFSPLTAHALALLSELPGPRRIRAIIHAGRLPADHWTTRPEQGGRLLGEAIHWLDWARAIAEASFDGSPYVVKRSGWSEIHLKFYRGHTAIIEYIESSPGDIPKERLEIEAAGRVIEIVDWRALRAHGWRGQARAHLLAQRGHTELLSAFLSASTSGQPAPVAVEEVFEIAQVSLALRSGT
jgi:predicted dehydrogenase/threonine dehydrogenase-like Zn-dependent dehydrogenase